MDTLTWARFQSRSPMLLFLQTLLTPVRIMLLQIFYFSSQCAGDICFHRILACCQSNRGGACRSENVFKSSEFPLLSLLPLLPIKVREDLLEHLWFPSVVHKLFLGPLGPLRTPLISVVVVVPLSAKFSDSKLILFRFQTLSSRNLSHSTQYTEHWT